MTEGKLDRRRFLQRLGLTALALPAATVVGKIGESELLASPRDYGGFLVRRLPKGKPNYQIDEARYRRFDQRNETFNKPEGWLHDATRFLIGAESRTLDKVMLKMDDASGFGRQADPQEYWKKSHFIHIK